jgi:hypothetical protein
MAGLPKKHGLSRVYLLRSLFPFKETGFFVYEPKKANNPKGLDAKPLA